MAAGRLIAAITAIAVLGIVGLFLVYAPHKQPNVHGEIATDTDVISDSNEEVAFREQAAADDRFESTESISAVEGQSQRPGFHAIDLTDHEEANLLQAPSVFLNREPSETLRMAIDFGQIDYVRADRDFSQNEYVTQGWIFYEPIEGQIPVVLCLSQTKTIIDWMYCQEETRPDTGRIPSSETPRIQPVEWSR